MKKFISCFILVMAISFIASAKQITESEALMKADKFSKVLVSKQLSAIGYGNAKMLKKSYIAKEGSNAFYYVFNRGIDDGYIIVSGDDRAEEILGYSDSGSFDYSNLPENMKWWLSSYEDQIKALTDGRITLAKENTKNATSATANAVAPLLKNIAWNQAEPYNNLCPKMSNGDRTVTGCVATAMAQIMYYHNWPEKGIGSVSYTTQTNRFNISVDFSNTTYQWGKMTPTYNSSSTAEANSAVATLMYHCGTASLMDYADSSGAQTVNAVNALINNFNYDKGLRYIFRDYYARDKWEELLKTELDNNRPIMYGGNSKSGGHQFVCDGYDANNMFHINWGWGGSSNGYFKIAALEPDTQGIGGSTSGYNYNQDMVINIQKPTSQSEVIQYEIVSDGWIMTQSSSSTLGDYASFSISDLWNMGYGTFDGKFGIGLFNSDTNELETVVESASSISLPSFRGWNTYNGLSATLPKSLKASRYKAKMMHKDNVYNVWKPVLFKVGNPAYIAVTVTGNDVKFEDVYESIALSATNVSVKGTVYKNRKFTVSCDVKNNGKDEYYAPIFINLANKSTGYNVFTGDEVVADILPSETQTIDFINNINLNPGVYVLTINDKNGREISTPIDITVLPEPVPAVLALTKNIYFTDNNNVPKNGFCLYASLKNTGGEFNDNIHAYIYPIEGGSTVGYISANATIETNATSVIALKGTLDINEGMYQTIVFTEIGNEWNQITPYEYSYAEFKLTSEQVGVEGVTSENRATVYPNPATDFITVKSEKDITAIRIFDIKGMLLISSETVVTGESKIDISSLSSGNYLIQVVIDGRAEMMHFIKK